MRLPKGSAPTRRPTGPLVDLDDYGLQGLPPIDPAARDGESVQERAAAYVDALGIPRNAGRGMLVFRVACVLEDVERKSAGLPSAEEEILGR